MLIMRSYVHRMGIPKDRHVLLCIIIRPSRRLTVCLKPSWDERNIAKKRRQLRHGNVLALIINLM